MSGNWDISEIEKRFVSLLLKPNKTPADIAEREKVRTLLEQKLAETERQLIDDLASTGMQVESVWDLVNTKKSYPKALPVLVKHLSLDYHPRIKEGIVRAVGVKAAKGLANEALLRIYFTAPKDREGLRWAVGNAFYNIVRDEDFPVILEISMNKSNGESRDMFVQSLGKIKTPASEAALYSLLGDEDVVLSALRGLAIIGSPRLEPALLEVISNGTDIQRKEAQKLYRKIFK